MIILFTLTGTGDIKVLYLIFTMTRAPDIIDLDSLSSYSIYE